MTTKPSRERFTSIIVPVYNDPSGLDDTLNSLLKQNYDMSTTEIIVIDNNSSDNTLHVAQKFQRDLPELITVLSETEYQSSYASRNRGVHYSTGSILAFIDAECIADENWLKNGIQTIEQQDYDLVAGDIRFTFKNSPPTFWDYYDSCRKLNQRKYAEQGFGATANLFVKRKVITEVGLFKPHLISGGDWEFGTRATRKGFQISFLETAIAYHPARSTFSAILKKSRRVATGQKQLEKEPGVHYSEANLRKVFSLKKLGPKNFHGIKANLAHRFFYPVVETFLKAYNYMVRKNLL